MDTAEVWQDVCLQRNCADSLPQCHWHCYIAFHAGAQATGAVNNDVHLQNQLGITLLLRVLSATKPQSSSLRCNFARKQPKELSRWGFITGIDGLAARNVLPVTIINYALYASRCRNKHFKICKNMQYQICRKYAQYAQMKYAIYICFIC